jgi:hypothetical protein
MRHESIGDCIPCEKAVDTNTIGAVVDSLLPDR